MNLITLIVGVLLIIVGFWANNTYIPIGIGRTIVNIVLIIIVIVLILVVLGITNLGSTRV